MLYALLECAVVLIGSTVARFQEVYSVHTQVYCKTFVTPEESDGLLQNLENLKPRKVDFCS